MNNPSKNRTPTNNKGFVRLDSFEDYEVIDVDMLCDQSNKISRPDVNNFSHKHQGDNQFVDGRNYHPAAYPPPPYSYSDCNIGMGNKVQHQLQTPSASDFVCQASKLAHQFVPWNPSCQAPFAEHKHPYDTFGVSHNTTDTRNRKFDQDYPFNNRKQNVTHHVPYNLTKGQYEYWMSIPGSGSASNCEAMQAYCHNQPHNSRMMAKQIPVSKYHIRF